VSLTKHVFYQQYNRTWTQAMMLVFAQSLYMGNTGNQDR